MFSGAKKNRGIALILSFLVLIVLTVVVMQLVYTSRVERSLARNFRDGLENLYAARSGFVLAKGVLLSDWDAFDSPEADWMRERTGIEAGEITISFVILDEEGKFNLRLITDPDEKKKAWARGVLQRLITLARERTRNSKEPSPQKIFETLVRWAERGETGRDFQPGGGGSGEEGRDRRFLSLKELLFIEDFTDELLYGEKISAKEEAEAIKKSATDKLDALTEGNLEDLVDTLDDEEEEGEEEEEDPIPLAEILTVWGNGKINLNTAPLIVLQSLHPQMTAELASALDERRKEPREPDLEEGNTQGGGFPSATPAGEEEALEKPGFRAVNEIKDIEGIVDAAKTPPLDIHEDIKTFLKVKSKVFRVRVIVKNEQLTQRYEAILTGAPKGGEEEPTATPADPASKAPPQQKGDEPPPEGGDEPPPADAPPPGEGPTPSTEPAQDQPVTKPEFRILRVVELD
ncbi:MAG: type II secretion system minor pseudopilin [Planctomycetota bacterium]|jgi:type II secretory pathway component PulK